MDAHERGANAYVHPLHPLLLIAGGCVVVVAQAAYSSGNAQAALLMARRRWRSALLMVGTSMCRGSRGPEMRPTILRLPTFSIGRGMGREIHTASSAWSKSLMDSGCCRRFSAFIWARAMTASCVDGARLSSWVSKTFWFMEQVSLIDRWCPVLNLDYHLVQRARDDRGV